MGKGSASAPKAAPEPPPLTYEQEGVREASENERKRLARKNGRFATMLNGGGLMSAKDKSGGSPANNLG